MMRRSQPNGKSVLRDCWGDFESSPSPFFMKSNETWFLLLVMSQKAKMAFMTYQLIGASCAVSS